MLFGNNLGKKTESARQALLKFIWDRQLAPGAKLPTQSELCRLFEVGGATMDRAVQSLVHEGVLEARRGVGVFVRTPRPEGHPGRAIGLLGQLGDRLHLFNWSLAYAIQNQLQLHGCQCISFPMRGPYRENQPLSVFAGLEATLAQRTLDGIICVTDFAREDCERLEAAGIEICFAGPPSPMKSGIFLDTGAFVRAALGELRAAGCRRPMVLVGPGPVEDYLLRILGELLPGWSADAAVPERALLIGFGIEGGCMAARRLLADEPSRRVDGVVLCDDIMAQGFFAELLRAQDCRADYLPFAVCMRNRQFEMDFPYRRLVCYEVDIDRIGEMAVDMLLDKLRNGSAGDAIQWYVPEKC